MKSEGCEFCQHDLLALFSRELRNPLAALSNSLYVLRKCQGHQERSQRAMAVIERQIRHLTTLVDHLTEAASLGRRARELQLHRIRIDLVELLRSVCLDHDDLCASRTIVLRQEIPRGPLWVSGDPSLLSKAFGNVLKKAVWFTPAGGHVELALDHDEPERRARVRVKDSGAGMDAGPPWELFSGADANGGHWAGGWALDLGLVKGIVELHGGSVRVECSESGPGSSFIVELRCLEPGLPG